MQDWTTTPPCSHVQHSSQVHVPLLAPIFTLCFLSLLVRTASSAVDPTQEKQKVITQLKQRLNEVQAESTPQRSGSVAPVVSPPVSQAVSPALTPAQDVVVQGVDGDTRSSVAGESFSDPLLDPLLDPLSRRIVSLTVSFEHGRVSAAEAFAAVAGDFDGQGLSFGLLQWNLGSCTLQPLLDAFRRANSRRFRTLLGAGAPFIMRLITVPCAEAPLLARRVLLDKQGDVKKPWVKRFRALGREQVFQEIQLRHLLPSVQRAYHLTATFGLRSERAVALFFDILIQNGGIPVRVRTQYERDVRKIRRTRGRSPDEVERMVILARRQAAAANPLWADRVRARKLAIALGTGSVNGMLYDLETLGIRLRDHQTSEAIAHNTVVPLQRPTRRGLNG